MCVVEDEKGQMYFESRFMINLQCLLWIYYSMCDGQCAFTVRTRLTFDGYLCHS